ncbi:hypothetical protein [Nocardia ninae]|uniref:hypothetical protein n=1 Tax=Nocardia ninae TaxID=356145 RepID=UPI0011BF21F6|nr:hypothetical protein [Nocardia ninae]
MTALPPSPPRSRDSHRINDENSGLILGGTIIGRQAFGPPTEPVLQLRDLAHAAAHGIGAAAMMGARQ